MKFGTTAQIVVFMFAVALGSLQLAAAQEMSSTESEILRSEIRAALLADDRSVELSEDEVALLVETLAGEAEAQGVVADFLPTIVPMEPVTPAPQYNIVPALFGVVLVSLALAMITIKRIIDHHHAKQGPPDMPPGPAIA